jgi:polysaccharide export outer membrane protein
MKHKVGKGMLLAGIILMAAVQSWAVTSSEERKDAEYIIGSGDVLIISIWKDEALTREVAVLPDGTISFPLIGSVMAGGKTVGELKKDIEGRIKRYVPDPVLSVVVKNVNSMFIYVIGRVNNPGRFILNGTVNVLQALAMAGGLTPFADNNGIKIFRSEGGANAILKFRYNDVAKGKHLEQNIMLKRGDVIVVP